MFIFTALESFIYPGVVDILMTIWDEIQEAQGKKGERVTSAGRKILVWGLPMRETGEEVEFGSMEETAKQAIEDYVSKLPARVDRDLELRACDAILKYLIFNYLDLDMCGERSMSERLGIPRWRLRSLLSNMEWNGIIKSVKIGTTNPYRVTNLAKALKDGYLDIASEDAAKLMSFSSGFKPLGRLYSAMQASMPESKLFTEAFNQEFNYMLSLGHPQIVNVPFNPSHIQYNIPIETYLSIVKSFVTLPAQGDLIIDLLMEMGVPEEITTEEARQGLKRLGEKYLRLARISIKPLLDLLLEHGYEETRNRIQKAYLKDMLIRLERDPEGRQIHRFTVYAGEALEKDVAFVPGHGVVSEETQELTPSHVRLIANIYRTACDLCEQLGGDDKLIDECRGEAAQLESFLVPQPDQMKVEQGDD
jgi:hypothetical protein